MKYLRPTSPRVQVSYRPNVAQPPRRLNDPTAPLPHAQHVQPWPLHEDDVDLPTELPPELPEPSTQAPQCGDYIGSVNVQPRAVAGQLTWDLLIGPDFLEFGPYRLDPGAVNRLCVLFNLARIFLIPTRSPL